MSTPLLILIALVYVWVGIGYYNAGRTGMCLAFICYALSNIGFAMDAWQ